jgi:ketosteroid isomerase-like protein
VTDMNKVILGLSTLLLCAAAALPQQTGLTDDGGKVLALEKAWNHALEEKDTKALDQLLGVTFVSIETDGSISSKTEFLAGIKAPDYKPSQVVTEQTNVQVYGSAAVVTGIFRVKEIKNGKPRVRRERFTDVWVKMGATWQCVATQSTLIPAKAEAD